MRQRNKLNLASNSANEHKRLFRGRNTALVHNN